MREIVKIDNIEIIENAPSISIKSEIKDTKVFGVKLNFRYTEYRITNIKVLLINPYVTHHGSGTYVYIIFEMNREQFMYPYSQEHVSMYLL